MNAEQLAEELNFAGLNFNSMEGSTTLVKWSEYRLDLATALLEKLDIKYKSNSRFKKPTIEEIKSFCRERSN